MKLEIGNYVITSDERQFIVNAKMTKGEGERVKIENVGKDYLKPIGYFTEFNSALKSIPQKALMQSDDVTDLKELLRQIDEDIKAIPTPIKVEVEKVVVKKDSKTKNESIQDKIQFELQKEIVEEMPSDKKLEDYEPIEVNGVKYSWYEEEELTTEDEGKYQYGGSVYAVGVLDEESGYGIKGEPLFYVRQNFTQCGSYFSYQEITFEKPYIVKQKQVNKTIWVKK